MEATPPEHLYTGRHLALVRRGRWEYVTRTKATGVVAVVAMHEDGRVVMVEQPRPVVKASVIELPAGLVGDEDDAESLLTAAQRELLEETGYEAEDWVRLASACSSPGLTDEAVTFFLARGLRKAGAGGGVGSESIVTHEVSWKQARDWLSSAAESGFVIDMKTLAGLYQARMYLEAEQP